MISYYLSIVFLEIRRSRGEQGIQEVFSMFSHQIFFCILDEISLLEDPRWVWTQLPRSATSYTFSNVLFEKPLYSSFFQGGGLSERRAQPRLSTLALSVHLQHALLQARLLCTLSTLCDLQSTLVAHSQRWRVVLVRAASFMQKHSCFTEYSWFPPWCFLFITSLRFLTLECALLLVPCYCFRICRRVSSCHSIVAAIFDSSLKSLIFHSFWPSRYGPP